MFCAVPQHPSLGSIEIKGQSMCVEPVSFVGKDFCIVTKYLCINVSAFRVTHKFRHCSIPLIGSRVYLCMPISGVQLSVSITGVQLSMTISGVQLCMIGGLPCSFVHD